MLDGGGGIVSITARIIIAAALMLALLAGLRQIDQRGYARAKAEDMAAIEQQKREATAELLRLTDQVHATESRLQAALQDQNTKDYNHAQTIAALSDRLRAYAGPGLRLRDPHATGCGPGGTGPQSDTATAPDAGTTDPAQAGGLLSAELTGLLQRLAREADDINAAYTSCRADAYTVRGEQLPP